MTVLAAHLLGLLVTVLAASTPGLVLLAWAVAGVTR